MSEMLVSLGLDKPKKIGLKQICMTVILAALALFIGLSVASSLQAADKLAFETMQSQGLQIEAIFSAVILQNQYFVCVSCVLLFALDCKLELAIRLGGCGKLIKKIFKIVHNIKFVAISITLYELLCTINCSVNRTNNSLCFCICCKRYIY